MTGTTIAQAIPIAISPILTRIYTPEDFGMFALFISATSVFATVVTGRYSLAIMLPKKDSEAVNIVFLSILIAIIVSICTLIIVFFFNQTIADLLGDSNISSWLYLIPVSILFSGIYQSCNYWSNRKKQFKRLAMNKIIQSGTNSVTNLGMGFNGFGASGLIVGSFLGQITATFVLAKKIWKEDNNSLRYVKKLKVFALMKRYKKLPFFNLPNALIDTFRLSGINILIAKFFTTATLGQFSFAWKILQAPLALIGGSLSQVFFQEVASANKVDLSHKVKIFLIKASLVATPIFTIIYLFSVDIFVFIFGKEWQLAGEAASVMAPWLFLNFLSSPLSTLFLVLDKQDILLIFSILFMIVPLSIIIAFKSFDFIDVLWLITSAMSIMLMFIIVLVVYYVHKEKANI